MDITVYSKPLCVQCDATKRALNKAGIAYSVVDITEDAEALATIKGMGYLQAPVVITGEDHWSGFRPDKIKALVGSAATARTRAAV
ncbi:glutaredoxin-like protein NrdH [Brachybacterium sp. AOP25-B2-12]|uniref:glutaredoxin-like protein NrdH n=1 Tax=Brachybacterium sp. AOP25-B2-12 TaxID=3457710 RepID=UPI004033C714